MAKTFNPYPKSVGGSNPILFPRVKTWSPLNRRQESVFERSEFEIFIGGSRGGGKSEVGRSWLMTEPHVSHPGYHALILRKNSVDMADWIFKFKQQFAGLCEVKGNPPVIRFPGGGRGTIGHLADKSSWSHYVGGEFSRILFEELNLIDSEQTYLMVLGSCRSSIPELFAQVLSSGNPGGAGHCVAFGDVLTSSGWKPIQDVRIGDMVATVDEAETLIYAPVDQVTAEHYCGDLLEYSKPKSTLYIQATPSHKLAMRTETKNKSGRIFHGVSLREFDKLANVTRIVNCARDWCGVEIGTVEIPNTESRVPKLKQPLYISGDDYCSFMGWFLSEGSTPTEKRSTKARVSISQLKVDTFKMIENLLRDMGIKYKVTPSGFDFYSRSWKDHLSQFGRCREKFIPNIIKSASRRQLALFLKTALLGDGKGNVYYTTSRQLADDMQEIGLKLGYSPRITTRHRENRLGFSYEINFREHKDGWVEKKEIKRTPFNGTVYCIGIDKYHKFFIRQNGIVWLSGNSWVKKRFVDCCREKAYIDPESGLSRIFVPLYLRENTKLPGSYEATLRLQSEAVQRAWIHGDWDAMAGQMFPHLPPLEMPFIIPSEECRLEGSMDFGSSTTGHTSFGLWWTDKRGLLHRLMTYYHKIGRSAGEQALELKDSVESFLFTNGHAPSRVYCDPSMFAKRKEIGIGATPKSIADIFEEGTGWKGVWVPAPNNRVNGWRVCQQYFSADAITKEPRMVVWDAYNQTFYDSFEVQIRALNNPDDCEPNDNDHGADEARYYLSSHLSMKEKLVAKMTGPRVLDPIPLYHSEVSDHWMAY